MILELKLKAEIIREKNKLDNEQKNKLNKPYYRGGSRGRVQRGAHPPPLPSPEMTSGFLIQLVFCKKKLFGLLELK